jgi:hypothetical protein
MIWDPKEHEAAVFSAAIKSHRSGSAILAPPRIFLPTSEASSSTPASAIGPQQRNRLRSFLRTAIQRHDANAAKARDNRQTREASIYERSLRSLRIIAIALGPMEPEPPLVLTDSMRAEDPPLTAKELAQAVALGLRLQGSA